MNIRRFTICISRVRLRWWTFRMLILSLFFKTTLNHEREEKKEAKIDVGVDILLCP